MQATSGTYNDKVVRQFAVMTVVWGIVGMLVGVIIAAQLYWPTLGEGIPWLGYGRLRPLHTNAVVAHEKSGDGCAPRHVQDPGRAQCGRWPPSKSSAKRSRAAAW